MSSKCRIFFLSPAIYKPNINKRYHHETDSKSSITVEAFCISLAKGSKSCALLHAIVNIKGLPKKVCLSLLKHCPAYIKSITATTCHYLDECCFCYPSSQYQTRHSFCNAPYSTRTGVFHNHDNLQFFVIKQTCKHCLIIIDSLV